MMKLDKIIKNRHSVRKFKNKKADWRDVIECVDSMRFAPMAGGIFSLRIIIVEKKELIEKIAQSAQQEFISNASYVVVICTDKKMSENAYEERAERYCRQQAGAAIENFLLKIEDKNLASCWVGAFDDNSLKRELSIPENIFVEAVLPVGIEHEKYYRIRGKRKTKANMDSILFFNKYGNKKMRAPVKPEA